MEVLVRAKFPIESLMRLDFIASLLLALVGAGAVLLPAHRDVFVRFLMPISMLNSAACAIPVWARLGLFRRTPGQIHEEAARGRLPVLFRQANLLRLVGFGLATYVTYFV